MISMKVDYDQIGYKIDIFGSLKILSKSNTLILRKFLHVFRIIFLPFWDLTCFNMSFLAGKGENWKKVADLSDDICD